MAVDETLHLGIEVTADVTKAKQAFNKLKDELSHSLTSFRLGEALTPELEQAVQKATQFRGILDSATDATGNFDLTKLTRELDRSKMSMQEVYVALHRIGADDAFLHLTQQMQGASTQAKLLHGTLAKFWQGLKNTASWTLQSNAIHAVQSALQGALSYAQQLNKGLTDIAIVSDLNTQQLTDFAKTANQMAKELSANTKDVISGALIYYQAGLSDEEVLARTETTIKLAQTSGESAEQISSYMTAIWNNFYDGSKSVEYYADAISYLGAVTAASNADIAEGMQSFAATAETVGLSFEYGASALTLLRDVTQQSASTIGNSLKTIFARLSSLKQGESLEDGVDLTKYSQSLENVGVHVLDINGNLRDMDDILDDLAVRWNTLDNAQKAALAQTVGGVRQYNNLISLMDNYERFQELVSGASSSEGYLTDQASEYADSWEAAKNRLTAAWQDIYDQLVNDKFIIKLKDFLTSVVNLIANIMRGMGGLKGVLATVVNMITSYDPAATARSIHSIVTELKNVNEILNDIAGKRNKAYQADAIRLAVGMQNTNNEDIFGMFATRNTLVEKYISLQDSVEVKERGAIGASIERLNAQINKALDLDKAIESLNSDYVELASLQERLKDAKALNGAVSQFGTVGNWQNQRKHLRSILENNATFGLGDDAKNGIWTTLFGSPTAKANWAKIGKEQIQIAMKAMQDELQKQGAGFKDSLQNALGFSTLGKDLEAAGIKSADVKNIIKDINTELEKDKESGQDIVKNAEYWDKILERVLQKYGNIDDKERKRLAEGIASAGRQTYNPESDSQSWSQIATSATRAATAVVSLSSAIDGCTSAVKEWHKGNIDFGQLLSQLIGGLSSGVYAVVTLKNALEALNVAAATTNWIIAAIVASLVIIKLVANGINAETVALKENVEIKQKELDTQKELSASTTELANSVLELVDAYNQLAESGGDTFDTLNDLKTQGPELIKQYKELAQVFGQDWSAELTALQNALDINDWETFAAIINGLQTKTAIANTQNAQERRANALENMAANGKGRIEDGRYTHTILAGLFDNRKVLDIAAENLGEFAEGGTHERITVARDQMDEYYERLIKTRDALKEAGYESSKYYTRLSREISALAPEYEKFTKEERESLSTFAADFDATVGSGANPVVDSFLGGSMSDYVSAEGHQALISALAEQYNITDEDAEFILRNSDTAGAGERLYQKWLNELTVAGDEAATQSNLDTIAGWFDSIPEAYRSFAITLTYDKTRITDPAYLNELTSEAAEAWRKSVFQAEGEERGLKVDDMQKYADYLASIADDTDKLTGANDKLANSLKEDSDAALLVARSVMSMNKGIETLNKNWKNWGSILRKSSKDSQEYYEALMGTKEAIGDLFEVSTQFVENDFIDDHLNEIEKAAEGNAAAIDKLRAALADDIIENIVATYNGNLADGEDPLNLVSIQSKVTDLRSWLEAHPIEVGAQMNLDHLEAGEEGFLQKCQDIVNSAHMTAEQANAFFDAMGFETTFVTEQQPVTKTGHSTVTSTRIRGYDTVTVLDGNGQPEEIRLPSYETFTYPGTAYQYTDYVDAIAMSTDSDGNPVAPKIESITRKAGGSMNNMSSSNRGGGSGGGGGGGSKTKTKTATRYHEITSKLEQTSHALDMVNKAESEAYGPDKLALMDEKIKLLEQETDQYQELYDEAKAYYDADKAHLADTYGAQFNPDGSIANYDAWYQQFLDKYNSGNMDDEAWSAFEDAISKYEDSLKHLNDAEKNVQDNLIEIFNQKLEKIEYKLKYLNTLIDKDIDYLDFMIEQLDKNMYSTADVLALIGDRMGKVLEKAENERAAIAGILGEHKELSPEEIQQFLDGQLGIEDIIGRIGQLTDKEIQDLQNHQTALLEYSKELIKMREDSYAKISESIGEFNDQIERQIDIVNDAAKVMKHWQNIVDIVGKDTLGVSDEMLADMDRVSVLGAKSSLEISTDQLEKNKQILEDLYKQRAEMAETASEEDKRLMDEEIKKQEDEVRRLTESWASSWEEALHTAEEAFKNSIKRATDTFSQAMAGSLGNLENFQEAFDQQKQLNERYLPAYERIYELNKLTRDVAKSIDSTNNIAGKERLLKLQQEILERQESGAEITEYEVGMLQRRLELEQARIAMEEAQNTKNMVRMTRDNEGNWSYTYTADASRTAEAEQEYEDKLYNLKKFNQESLTEFEAAMWKAVEDYKNSIADMNYTDEERAQRIHEFQQQWIEHNGKMFQMALDDANMIIDEYGSGLDDLQNKWSDTVSGQISDYASLEEVMDNFNTSSTELMESVKSTYSQWKIDYTEIFGAAGTSVKEFAQDAQDAIDETIKKMVGDGEEDGGAVGAAKDFATEMKNQFDGILSHIKTWLTGEDGYFSQIDAIVEKNGNWYSSIQNLITEYGKLEKAQQEQEESGGGGGSTPAPSTSDSGSGSGSGSGSSSSGNTYTPVWTWTEIRNPGGGLMTYTYKKGAEPNSLKKPGWQWRKLDQRKNPMGDWYYPYGKNSGGGGGVGGDIMVKADTGMYTGSWGPEGKIAMLHEKELVLNKEDTANMLKTVGFVRDITQMLSLNASAMGGGLGALSSAMVGAGGSYLDQNVTIHAEFPNATNHSEIEEAFNNLIGLASQYAGRKQ